MTDITIRLAGAGKSHRIFELPDELKGALLPPRKRHGRRPRVLRYTSFEIGRDGYPGDDRIVQFEDGHERVIEGFAQ